MGSPLGGAIFDGIIGAFFAKSKVLSIKGYNDKTNTVYEMPIFGS